MAHIVTAVIGSGVLSLGWSVAQVPQLFLSFKAPLLYVGRHCEHILKVACKVLADVWQSRSVSIAKMIGLA